MHFKNFFIAECISSTLIEAIHLVLYLYMIADT